ncbi:MAG: hypothetical protein JWM95_1793 [Gemmatimonadetes bacterium]|nr:hypothetical protein [Gemmatimonadota bacterium]
MSIHHSSSLPPDGRAVVARHLTALLSSPTPSAIKSPSKSTLEVTDGYPVFIVDLDDLERGEWLSRAKRSAFRYLVLDGASPIAEAELIADERSEPRVVMLHSGTHAKATAESIEAAERLAGVKTSDYEVAVIEAPGVQFSALWLHRSDSDVIVPTTMDMSSLVHGQAYGAAEVARLLAARAREVREMQAAYPGPSGA